MENLSTRIATVLNSTDTANWKSSDLKTTWLGRARRNGLEGHSKALKEAFVALKKGE